MYLGIDSVPSNRDVDFTAIRGSNYKYSITVTQINCNTDYETMKDLQYFTESGGTIQSFNYDGVNAYSINQDYSICIARSAKNCGIKYTNPTQKIFFTFLSLLMVTNFKCDSHKSIN